MFLEYVQMNALECLAVGWGGTNIVWDVLHECCTYCLAPSVNSYSHQNPRSHCSSTSACYCKPTIRMVWWQFCLLAPCCRSRQPEAQWGGGTCTLGEEDPSWQGEECTSDQEVRCSSLCCDGWRNGSSEALHPHSVTPHEWREPLCPPAATAGTQSSVGAL
jgi:hypothetical protein